MKPPFMRELLWVVACIFGAGVFISVFPWHGIAWYFNENGALRWNLPTMFRNMWRYGIPLGLLVYAAIAVLRLMRNWRRGSTDS